jgi:hypothetical protein
MVSAAVAQYKGRSKTRAGSHSSTRRRYVKQWTSQTTHQEPRSNARQTGHAARQGPVALQLNCALHQPRHCRSQHPVRLFSSQQPVSTATSCHPGTSTAGSIHHERSACHRARRHKLLHGDFSYHDSNYGIDANIVQPRLNKYIYVGTVTIISPHRTVPHKVKKTCSGLNNWLRLYLSP